MSGSAWDDIRAWLRAEVGEQSFESWLNPLALDDETLSSPNDTYTVIVPTRFMRDWVVRHYSDLLTRAFAEKLNRPIDIHYVVKGEMGQTVAGRQRPQNSALGAENTPKDSVSLPASANMHAPTSLLGEGEKDKSGSTPLDPRFTFDTFVTGKSNEFAYAAAKRIAETTDIAYNPFFVYGGVGLGKTHLAHAIAWEKKRLNPNINILYVSAEKFMNLFVTALRNRTIQDFKTMFRSVDLLMVDDIQFIGSKDSTQEEFFHTFNTLIEDRKQIVLTADKSPHELEGIEDRLRSRFAWGLATEVHKPALETRMAILQQKAAALHIPLRQDVAHFLAEKIDSNVRELEGALNRLVAHATLVQQEITIAAAQDLLKDLFRVYERVVTIDDIQRKVCEHFSIKMSEMIGPRRSRAVARPRQVAMFLTKNCTSKSYPEIGRAFGGRDHTTVMHAVDTIQKHMENDASLREDVHLLTSLLKG